MVKTILSYRISFSCKDELFGIICQIANEQKKKYLNLKPRLVLILSKKQRRILINDFNKDQFHWQGGMVDDLEAPMKLWNIDIVPYSSKSSYIIVEDESDI